MGPLVRSIWMAALLGAWTFNAAAQEGDATDLQRRAIDAQRRALLADLESKDVACLSRFLVNDCQSQVAAQRRKALAEFKRQEMELDEAQRRQRTAEQLQRLTDKQAERKEREAQRPDPDDSPLARQLRQDEKQASHLQQATANQRAAVPPKIANGPDAQERKRNLEAADERKKALDKRKAERDQRLLDHPNAGPPLPVEPR